MEDRPQHSDMRAAVSTRPASVVVSLDIVRYGTYVEILSCPNRSSLNGRICLWTGSDDGLIPLDHPRDAFRPDSPTVMARILKANEEIQLRIIGTDGAQ